jgi:hypothetical protein
MMTSFLAEMIVATAKSCSMIRPDHAWWFFTVVLSLALAMSAPQRKAEPRDRISAFSVEQTHQR